jgi:type IV secretory pathway TrbF-like protein
MYEVNILEHLLLQRQKLLEAEELLTKNALLLLELYKKSKYPFDRQEYSSHLNLNGGKSLDQV